MQKQLSPRNPAEMYENCLVPAMFAPLAHVSIEKAAPSKGERALDVACGTGIVARGLAPVLGASGGVTAVDLRSGMLQAARSLPTPDGATIEWLEGDATALDLPDDSFDLVMCQQGLQFFSDRIAALRQMRRVLKEGGRAVVSAWRGLEHQTVFEPLAEISIRHLGSRGDPRDLSMPFSLGNADELRSLAEEAGFRNVEVEPVTVETCFSSPDTFVADVEFAYSAVVPEFVQDPSAFGTYTDAVAKDMQPVLTHHQSDGELRFPMPAHLLTARK